MHGNRLHAIDVDPQIVQEELDQLARVALGLEQEHGAGIWVKLFDELKNKRRLTQARRRNQDHEATISLNAAVERCQRLAVAISEIEKPVVWCNAEWLFLHLVIIAKHKTLSSLGRTDRSFSELI